LFSIPTATEPTIIDEIGSISIFFAILESTHKLVARRFDYNCCSVSFSLEPFSFINASIGIYVCANSMSPVVLDLPNIFVLSPPGALDLCTRLEQSQEVLACAPIIKPFSVKHVVLVVAVVIFVILEDLESQSISTTIMKITIVYISIDPYPLVT